MKTFLHALLALSLFNITPALAAPRTAQDQPAVLAPGSRIAVIKRLCQSIGSNGTCNGRDTSLDGYSIAFNYNLGTTPTDPPDGTVTVTLQDGDGSQGKRRLG
jgi:hypothetical protein